MDVELIVVFINIDVEENLIDEMDSDDFIILFNCFMEMFRFLIKSVLIDEIVNKILVLILYFY